MLIAAPNSTVHSHASWRCVARPDTRASHRLSDHRVPATQDREREAARILNPAATAYDVLDVAPNATHGQIAARHKELQRHWHPDRHRNNTDLANRVAQKINESWETLKDPPLRQKYDHELRRRDAQAARQAGAGVDASIASTLQKGSYGRILEAMKKLPQGFSLSLPQIVVVGVESAGKSSLMERIAMREFFPRADGFCTRMPIRLKMMHQPHESRVTIRCLHTNTGQVAVYNGSEGPERAEKRYDVEDVQHTAIEGIIKRFIEQVHGQDNRRHVLTEIEIEIEIRACNVPTLTLVDLPGLVSMPPEVREQTLQLTRTYLSRPNTLVLCVIDGNTATLRGGAKALEEIRDFSKTIVVMPKVDKMVRPNFAPATAEGLAALADRLADPSGELGCEPVALIPVINRMAQEISLPDLVIAERDEFQRWKTQQPGLEGKPLGILAVLSALNELFETHMSEVWVPAETRKLLALKEEKERDLAALGESLSGSEEQAVLVLEEVSLKMRERLESAAFDASQSANYNASSYSPFAPAAPAPAAAAPFSFGAAAPAAAPAGIGTGANSASPWASWPATPAAPLASRGASRLRCAEDRLDSQKLWKDNIHAFNAKRLVSDLVDQVMADSDSSPLRIKRLCKLAAYIKGLAITRIGVNFPPIPPDLTCANVESKLIDAAFETVLVPLLRGLKSPEFRKRLLTKSDWCEESAEVADQRATCKKQMSDIDAACQALQAVQHAVRSRSVPPSRPPPASSGFGGGSAGFQFGAGFSPEFT